MSKSISNLFRVKAFRGSSQPSTRNEHKLRNQIFKVMNYKDVLIQNKKVTEADRKMVEQFVAPHYLTKESNKEQLVEALSAFVFSLQSYYGFMGWSPSICKKLNISAGKVQQIFDRSRYLILKLDSDYYMAHID